MKKTGILEFRYGHSESFAKRLRRKGSYTINLGDWIQSLAEVRADESCATGDQEFFWRNVDAQVFEPEQNAPRLATRFLVRRRAIRADRPERQGAADSDPPCQWRVDDSERQRSFIGGPLARAIRRSPLLVTA